MCEAKVDTYDYLVRARHRHDRTCDVRVRSVQKIAIVDSVV